MLKLYGFRKVNAVARCKTRDLRILWALEEIQIPFELVGMDHPAHDLNTDAYRRISPFEQIPVIDDDGVVLSESARHFDLSREEDEETDPERPRWRIASSTLAFRRYKFG